MIEARPALRIDRARLAHARPGDRERLAHALELASPAATGVDARGLLLIRKLRMQRPLAAGMEGFAGELIERIRAAKLGARGAAPDTADSLYFADEIALECAIVAAWLEGAPLPRLVQAAVPQSATPQLRWRRRILIDPVRLPRLVAALVEVGIAGSWLAHFEDGELRAATDLVIRAHGGVSLPIAQPETLDVARANPDVPPTRAVARVPAIAEAIAIARGCAEAPVARALIAIALLAVRRPELLATAALAEARAAWLAVEPLVPAPREDVQARRQTVSPAAVPVEPVRPSADTGLPARSAKADGGRQPRRVRAASPVPISRRTPPGATAGMKPARPVRRKAETVVAVAPHESVPVAVTSEHAGLFFLLNIFLALGLYGDFTDPARRVRGLSPFALILLLARRWIGPSFAADPLVPALRELAGLAPRERIGRNFEAPAWQVPPDWLAPWPAAPARVVRGRFGASDWHRSGFVIGDHWHAPRPAAWMRRRWVDCLARYLEARIARALGSDDPAAAVATLIRRQGTVRIDPEEIAVAFVLDTHPLAIRLAGLDRDPGRIPAAGRSVGFSFT